MFLHVIEAKYIDSYEVWLKFNDDSNGKIDLTNELKGEIFEPLKNIDFFKNFKLECNTLSWENGADFAPEFLKSLLIDKNSMRIIKVTPIDDYKLIVEFNNQITKQYDMSRLFHLEAFKPLENKFLFKQAKADKFGYGVIWNDEIDISEYELWENGTLYETP